MSNFDQRIESELFELLRTVLPGNAHLFTRDTLLADAGINSLALVETVFAIEEKFDVTIPYNANDWQGTSFSTVGDVLDLVVRLIVEKSAGQSPCAT
ncbi:acyl carrier protein [Pseudorhodoferax sp. Leaf274]|uniref:acyl carrier protein n=1 Tax=Pseudorhodoferax sp. Leaf274 TaxID=1736318 RepID=UPI0012E3114B|nr:phosphopantetheine-binding protein [Pseudorhodoferax sp. Leaf274]